VDEQFRSDFGRIPYAVRLHGIVFESLCFLHEHMATLIDTFLWLRTL